MRNVFILIIDTIFGIITGILILRIILKILGANPLTPFTHWVYSLSLVFLTPFTGIFHGGYGRRGSIFDSTAIFSLLIYTFLGLFLDSFFEKITENGKCRQNAKKITTNHSIEYETQDF